MLDLEYTEADGLAYPNIKTISEEPNNMFELATAGILFGIIIGKCYHNILETVHQKEFLQC